MKDIARCMDDFELLVAIQAKNLSSPSCFVTLAGLFRDRGRKEEALRCVEQGIAAFPNERNDDLLSLAIELQLALARRAFTHVGHLATWPLNALQHSATMTSMERKLNYVVFPEDGVFVARCLDVEVASDGPTEQEAVANLKEALELYFEDHEDTLAELPPRTYQFGEVAVNA